MTNLPPTMKLEGRSLIYAKLALFFVLRTMAQSEAKGRLPLLNALKEGLFQLCYHPWETPNVIKHTKESGAI
ncbi:MAG TPA: hypothetical protein VJ044_07680 [Candidatus Hodarchaeales archaeon]|nr:hypothetical protein [Candidatus Hodarchaeales archaeon]